MSHLKSIFRAGFVRRWHTNPDLAHTCDRIDGHGARVARIILALHRNPSPDLLKAALVHDDGESVTGDMNVSTKGRFPVISDALKEAEYLASVDLWGHWMQPLSKSDEAWLKLADRLDAYMWAQHHAPQIMDRDGWPEAREWIIEWAGILGCLARVLDAIGGDVSGGKSDAA